MSMPDFAELPEASGASLRTYLDWKSQTLLNGAPAALQYGDLHGVPMMLVLCEKGRMGDTFPQTFRCACIARALILCSALCSPAALRAALLRQSAVAHRDFVASCCRCLDLRLRTSENFTTFVQVKMPG